MADSDSFINEVSEEVRRDRLFAFFRRWGWAFALGVLLIVGAAGYNEYRRAQTVAVAERFGDAVLAALENEEVGDRIAALEAITTEGTGAEMLLALLIAGQESEAGDAASAAERLRAVASRSDMPERYRDLALLKAHLLSPAERAEAMVTLDRLARPGAPYRALAIEQQAYMMIEDGDLEDGLALLEDLRGEASATAGLQDRVRQLIVALQSGASLTDEPLPEPELELPAGLLDLPVGVELVPSDDDEAPVTDDSGAETETQADDGTADDTSPPAPSE